MGVLIPSPHVTDSRTLNPISWTCLIWVFFGFSIVFPLINYGGDSSVLKIKNIYFCSPSPSWPRLRQYLIGIQDFLAIFGRFCGENFEQNCFFLLHITHKQMIKPKLSIELCLNCLGPLFKRIWKFEKIVCHMLNLLITELCTHLLTFSFWSSLWF